MKTTISNLHFEWQTMEDCFSRIHDEFGVDGVELSFHESFTRPHCTNEDIAAIRKANEPFGLSLCAHIWENLPQLGEAAAVEALLHWSDVCGKTGVHGMVIHGGTYPDRKEGIARTCRALEKALPGLEKAGIVLYLENHYAYSYRGCQDLFSEVWEFEQAFSLDSPSLRFCFDTGHANLTGNTADLLVNLKDYLSHIHIADNHGTDDDHCLYKTGKVRWDSLWDLFRTIQFNGTFCAEFPLHDDLAPFHRFMQDVGNYSAALSCPRQEAAPASSSA